MALAKRPSWFMTIALKSSVAPAFILVTSAVFADDQPLGDGKISASPRQGYVFSCVEEFDPNAGGAHSAGPWITGAIWNKTLKPSVDGTVLWDSRLAITLHGDRRIFSSNRLPSHPTGNFPIAKSDDAYAFDRNPNTIREDAIVLDLPAMPTLAERPTCLPLGAIGVMLSGAVLFNALDAAGRDAPAHEILDQCDGHPERRGEYHYHDYSSCLPDDGVKQPQNHGALVGFAIDGFGLFEPNGQNGLAVTNADLDACHGHTHELMWNGALQTIYHYHFTADYPYSLGCFTGQPVESK
jgi:hypothetical protein